MNGQYKHMYVDQNTEESHEYIIDEGDALANLRKYSWIVQNFHIQSSLFHLTIYISIHFTFMEVTII